MRTRIRHRLTYANVVSTLCLFIVLGGSSYAAIRITGKNIQNGSVTSADIKNNSLTSSDVKDGALLVKDFKASERNLLRGPAGTPGTPGSAGPKGDQGAPGQDLTVDSTLPAGKTETGVWGAAAGSSASGLAVTGLTFRPRLAAALDASHVVYVAGASASHCPGTGQAESGYLCVYQSKIGNLTFNGIGKGDANGSGAGVDGAILYMNVTGSGSYGDGTWAVTG